MVFHCPTTSKVHSITNSDSMCDNQSIGSTFSKNYETNRPEIGQGTKKLGHYNDWRVVPTGGEKARSNDHYQPHPCRYDEYERYQTGPKSINIIAITLGSENRKGNLGKEEMDSSQESGNKERSTQKQATDATADDITEETSNEDGKARANGDKTDSGQGGTPDGERDKEQGDNNNNNEGNGNRDEEQANESTPAFDVKVLQKFVIDFNLRTTPAATIGFVHKQFINEILTVAPSTTFVASNQRTIPTPAPITDIEHFPRTHMIHQKFFHRVDIRDKVSYTHDVYSSITAMEIKRRAMAFLQEHDMGMWSEEISNNTKVRVCWILNAHSKVSYRPLMTERLVKGIDAQKENYGDENNRLLSQLPKKMHHIEVQTRTVTHQGHQTVACCVMAFKPAAPVIRELVAMLDHDYLGGGTSIVSEAAARELDPGKYIEIINSNTAFHQNTRTISVKYIHDLFWGVQYRPCAEANYTTVREWIMTGSGVVSIEPTKDTEKDGRYIILCKAEGFPVFRRLLQVMFQTLVKTIEEDEELKKVALNQFQQYPTIIGPHKIGKYAEKNAKGLLSRIDVPTVPKPAIRPPSNKIEFDFGSAEGFPDIQAGTGVRKLGAKKSPKQQSWASVAALTAAAPAGNASVGSEASETVKSARSVRTGITYSDQQTQQSEAMSVLTEFISQARQEDAERRKEEREERKIDREERRLEAEERRRNEDRRDESNRLMFQTMMATLMTHNSNVATATMDPNTTDTNTNGLSVESNKKRTRKNDKQGKIVVMDQMEVDEPAAVSATNTGAQPHDVQENDSPPLTH